MNKTSGVIAVAVASAIWGLTTPALKIALADIPPFSAVFIRFFIASILVIPIYLSRKHKAVSREDLPALALLTIFGLSLHIGFFVFGLKFTSVVVTSLLIAASPLSDVFSAVLFLREKISRVHQLGLLVGFMGTLFIIIRPLIVDGADIRLSILGNSFVVVSVILGSVYVIGSKKLFNHYSPLTIGTFSFLIATVSFIPFVAAEAVINPSWVNSTSTIAWAAIIFCGVFASFAAYLLFIWGLARTQVQIEAALSYITPVISIAIGVFVLKEKLDSLFLLNAIIILVGVFLATKSKPHHFRSHHKV